MEAGDSLRGCGWENPPLLPSGERLHSELERSTMLLMGKSTISMVIFNSYVKLPEGSWFSQRQKTSILESGSAKLPWCKWRIDPPTPAGYGNSYILNGSSYDQMRLIWWYPVFAQTQMLGSLFQEEKITIKIQCHKPFTEIRFLIFSER